jgi:hypothetical protein
MKGKIPPFQNIDRLQRRRRECPVEMPSAGSNCGSPEVRVTAKEPSDVDHLQGSTGCYHSHHHHEDY